MAKELPYFKFEPSEWQNGGIQLCSLSAKGAFADICSTYWQRMGCVPYSFALRRNCEGNEELLEELIREGVLGVDKDDYLVIKFLDEQLKELSDKSEKARESAKKRWSKPERNADAMRTHSERIANAMPSHSECNANRIEEKRREEKRREEKRIEERNKGGGANTPSLNGRNNDDVSKPKDECQKTLPLKAEKEKEKNVATKKRKIEPPPWEEFINYVTQEVPGADRKLENIRLKYKSWLANNWKDGNDKDIKNWKTKIMNTYPHLKEDRAQNNFTPKGNIGYDDALRNF